MHHVRLLGMHMRTRWVAIALLLVAAFVPLVTSGAYAQETPAFEIIAPTAGAQVTANDVEVQLEVSNFTIDCAQAGRPDADSVGHIHVMIDGMTMAALSNFYCSETFTIPLDGLAAGPHTLIIDLSSNTHMDMMDTAQQVEIDYQPTDPVALPEANDQGEPGVELVSPLDGTEVESTFTIEVNPVNFTPSERLEGKQNVPGYGHYHVFVDTPMDMMGMEASPVADSDAMGTPVAGEGDHMMAMSMAGMVAMPGTNTFELDLSGWGPGEHTIWIEPVQNDHTMYESFGHIEFTVTIKG